MPRTPPASLPLPLPLPIPLLVLQYYSTTVRLLPATIPTSCCGRVSRKRAPELSKQLPCITQPAPVQKCAHVPHGPFRRPGVHSSPLTHVLPTSIRKRSARIADYVSCEGRFSCPARRKGQPAISPATSCAKSELSHTFARPSLSYSRQHTVAVRSLQQHSGHRLKMPFKPRC